MCQSFVIDLLLITGQQVSYYLNDGALSKTTRVYIFWHNNLSYKIIHAKYNYTLKAAAK